VTAQDDPGPSGRDLRSTALGRSAERVQAQVSNPVRSQSRKTRLALSLGLLAAGLLATSMLAFRPPATLTIVCRHDFRSAEIAVSIDGAVVHTETMTGAVKKWLGVLTKIGGTYARTLPVPSGKHVVEVRLRAPGYDLANSIQADFSRGMDSTLSVDSGRHLLLAWRETGGGATATGPASGSPPWFSYAGSVLMTLFGSVVSASIGVVVQDYLRTRKARLMTEVQQESSKIAS
jgi:hypothetical protein